MALNGGKKLLRFCKRLGSTLKPIPVRQPVFPLLGFSIWIDPYSLYEKLTRTEPVTSKANLYWQKMTTGQLIIEADKLYENGEYLQVYEILNRIKYNGNPEVQWRVCRVLFKMSVDPKFDYETKEEMISEAFSLINLALSLDTNNANIHKWMAIITDAKCGNDGLVEKIRSYKTIKWHMERAIELNPQDMVVLYMLGKWCYEMSRLTKFQRFIASILYGDPPESTYKEAFEHLVKSAELQDKEYYIPTFYVLGKTCIKLRQFYRARYYLHTASFLPPRNEYEERCAKKSKLLVAKLDKYDLAREIFYDFSNFADQV